MGARVTVLALLLLPAASASAQLREADPSPWHVDLDVSYGTSSVGFVGASDVVAFCPGEPCDVLDFSLPTARGTLGIGFRGLTAEASVTVPFEDQAADPYLVWAAGARLDTSSTGWLSVFFRVAYVRRTGRLSAEGGRVGIGVTVRPARPIAVYAEGTAEVTTVPTDMNDAGLFFSYATRWGAGLRLYFGQ